MKLMMAIKKITAIYHKQNILNVTNKKYSQNQNVSLLEKVMIR